MGEKAPAFNLLDPKGDRVKLSNFLGNPVVVYFYPADDTPGCTKEACQFQEALVSFKKAKVPVVGVSPDDASSHKAFAKKYGLNFTLLSDPNHSIMEKYGAWGEKTLYGKKMVGVIRSTFVIDKDGKIAKAWYNVRADGHAAKVLEYLETLS